jgi:hypothetical protein
MKPGPKKSVPSQKIQRGTYQPCRDGEVVELVEPGALPQQPDWLTPEGEEIWQDDVGRVDSSRLATEKDSTGFAVYCNLMGGIVKAFRGGEMPPVAAIAEARKMAEMFGIFGAKSRLKGAREEADRNPFKRNGRRG